MDLPNLQFWNCMDYGVVAVQKQFVSTMEYEVYTRDFGKQKGSYICTLDNYHYDGDQIDYSTSERPAEHKSNNIIELSNGQYCAYPNNRTRMYDNSLSPDKPLQPDFKVSTIEYQVENGEKFRLGNTDEYFYEIKNDKSKR